MTADTQGVRIFLSMRCRADTDLARYVVSAFVPTTDHPTLKLYGRDVIQSRSVAVYATRAMDIKYSGTAITVHYPFPPALDRMRRQVQDALGVDFNYVLLNRYDDGTVYIG
jgi:hypothetical protein